MKRILLLISTVAIAATSAMASEAPVKKDGSPMENGLTVGDCLGILNGLNLLDKHERQVVLKESVVVKLPPEYASGGLRLDISHNIAVLGAVQTEALPAQQKIFAQIIKDVPPGADGKPATGIAPGTPAAEEYDRQLKELISRPCRANIARMSAADLNVEKNQIPTGILAAIDKILDR